MIHYHGTPITPEHAAATILRGRHAFVSWSAPEQAGLAASVCQSFALDNGAFGAWRSGSPVEDWSPYYEWAAEWLAHPACDWAVIPDVVDGGEGDNDALADAWPLGRHAGVPVYHLHESPDRLRRLCLEWPRVAIGSSGAWPTPNTDSWWARVGAVLVAAFPDGRPTAKLHGLRMLDPRVFARLPLASADSTNVARNIGIDSAWRGTYQPATKAARGVVLADRIEAEQSAAEWAAGQAELFAW